MLRLSILLIVSVFVVLSACRRDGPTRWDVDGKAPLLKGRLQWSDLFADSLLSVDEEGVLRLLYSTELLNFDLDTLVAINDTVIRNQFEPPFTGGPVNVPPGTGLLALNEEIRLKTDGAALRHVRITSGTLVYTVRSYVNGALEVDYSLPGIILPSGSSPSLNVISGLGSPSQPWVFESSIDMTGVTIDLQGLSGSSFNRLASIISVRVATSNPAPVPVMGNDSVSIALAFTNVRVAYAKGYFGSFEREVKEEAVLFPFSLTGNINLEALALRLKLTNRVGADLQVSPRRLTAVSGDQSVDLVHALFNTPLNITRASDQNGQVIGNDYAIDITNENSNLLNFLGIVPERIDFDADITLNPLGNVSGSNDFIYTDQPFDAALEVEFPVAFGSSGLEFRDTLNVGTITGDLTADARLHLRLTNAFPLRFFDLSATYLPEHGEPFVLFSALTIEPASYLGQGNLTPVNSQLMVTLNRDQLAAMRDGGRVAVKARFSTHDEQLIRFTGEEYLDIQGVIDGSIEVSYR